MENLVVANWDSTSKKTGRIQLLGGSGLGYMEYAIIVEEIGRVDPSIGLGVAAHNGLCTGHINRFGSEELRQKYVPMLSKGETMGAWGLTEPGSGSDAGGTLTFAIQDGNEWVINGSKNFITHGSVGNVAVIGYYGANKDAAF